MLIRRIHYCFPTKQFPDASEKITNTFWVSFALRSVQYSSPQVSYDRDAGQMPAYFACLLLLYTATDDRTYIIVLFWPVYCDEPGTAQQMGGIPPPPWLSIIVNKHTYKIPCQLTSTRTRYHVSDGIWVKINFWTCQQQMVICVLLICGVCVASVCVTNIWLVHVYTCI